MEFVIHPMISIDPGIKDIVSAIFILLVVLPAIPGAVAYLLFKILGISGFRRLFSYEARDSPVHRMHPLTKLLTSSAIGVGVALIDSFLGLLIMLFLSLIIRLPAEPSERKVRGMTILLLSNLLLIGRSQSFLNPTFSRVLTGSARGMTVIYVFPKALHRMTEGITVEGFIYGTIQGIRVVAAMSAALRFISTTHPSEIVYGFKVIKFPVEITFMIAISIKSIPSILEKTSVVISAERARAMEIVPRKVSKNVIGQIIDVFKALIAALIPVIIETLREARQMALAATIKGFRAYKKRTYYKEISMRKIDIIVSIGVLGLLAFLIAAQFLAYEYPLFSIFQ